MAPKHMYDSAKAHARKDALKAKKAAAKKAGAQSIMKIPIYH